jgi:hypothetical protein
MYRYNFIKNSPNYKSFGSKIRNVNWKKLYHCYCQMMITFLIIGIVTMIVAIKFTFQNDTWMPVVAHPFWFKIFPWFFIPFITWMFAWLIPMIIKPIINWFIDVVSALNGE